MVNARGSMMFQTASKFFTLLGGVAVAGALSVAAPAQAATDDDDPYGDVPAAAAKADQNDAGFANLFASLQRLDGVTKASAYIPSGRPVSKLSLTSNFGVRSDPFNGGARMHKGIDIANEAVMADNGVPSAPLPAARLLHAPLMRNTL